MSADSGTGTNPDWHAAWVEALDRLELDVGRAEVLLRAQHPDPLPDWTPPVMRAPLPEDLVPRARLLLERQLAVAHNIAEAATRTRSELALATRIARIVPPEVPVYVDVTA